ncbi:MAG: DUF1786 domain-containing protein [Deltaproteobacteria bacterium]|nr:DUF1786 domain-containing protein [Deltaproteobacteria bacterium]
MHADAILAIDIGGGTQDLLLWTPEDRIENCAKLVLPSPTRIVAKRISRATSRRRPIFLYGTVMGGGSNTVALKKHLDAGLKAYAEKEAAATFHDNIEYVRRMGVEIVEEAPELAERIRLFDLDIENLNRLLDAYEVTLPGRLIVAVQDHGFSPNISNREMRFAQWKRFLDAGGKLEDLVYATPPPENTRMGAIHKIRPDALIVDTGPAAIMGAMLDDWAVSRIRDGLMVVNVGNAHTLAYLVAEGRVYGIYEHHTECLDFAKAMDQLQRFRNGLLTSEEVYSDMGHGVVYSEGVNDHFENAPMLATGPQRALIKTGDVHPAAPFGDMMLSGCFGLVRAALHAWKLNRSIC